VAFSSQSELLSPIALNPVSKKKKEGASTCAVNRMTEALSEEFWSSSGGQEQNFDNRTESARVETRQSCRRGRQGHQRCEGDQHKQQSWSLFSQKRGSAKRRRKCERQSGKIAAAEGLS
jgi:hypothetical protein